ARDAGRPRGRLGRQHHDLHDRVAPDRAGPELQPGERFTAARMDREQLRGLLAPDGQYRRHQGPVISQSTDAPEKITAFAHFSVSAARNAPNAAGVTIIGAAPSSAKRALIFGSAR